METLGIQNIKEVVKFVIELGEGIDRSLADKKIDFQDIGNLLLAMNYAAPAFDDIGKVVPELKDMDESEKQELKDYIKSEFDIANDKLEVTIEKALAVVIDIYGLIQTIRQKDDVPSEA
jgi:hypothetical protein